MGDTSFITYLNICLFALGILGFLAFFLMSTGSSSKYWLSLSSDRFTVKVKLTPPEVQRRLAATINPFTPESSGPYIEQWVTTDAFQIDRFAKSWFLSAHGEIWPHPEGALIRVTLRASGLVLVLLSFLFVVNPRPIASPTSLTLLIGLMLVLGAGYYYYCLVSIRRAKTFLMDLLNSTESDELPAAKPGAAYHEPILFDDHAELDQYKNGLVLTSARMSSDCYIIMLIGGIWAVIMLLLTITVVREVRAPVLVAGSPLWFLLMIFYLAMLGGGLVLLYYALAVWLNRTVLTITRQWLSVRYRPLPVYSDVSVPTAELRQLYLKRVVVLSNKGGGEVVVTYELRAILKNNKHITLFEFKSPEELLYTKQQIEAWLRLNNIVLETPP
jgi:hypothetical protein